jgi:signal transduction histidine kinase
MKSKLNRPRGHPRPSAHAEPPRAVREAAAAKPDMFSRYLLALRHHLDPRRPRGVSEARALGREVLASGFTLVDLARLHHRSLVALTASRDITSARHDLVTRAGKFYLEALVPFERVRRTTAESLRRLRSRTELIRLHAAALAKGNRRLTREVARRQAGEASVVKGREEIHRLLVASQAMQKKLRHLTRQVLSTQEDERRHLSRELHDGVVQLLVGVNVELVALGRAPALTPRRLQARIKATQRLVERTVATVHQFARELRPPVLDHLGLIPALQVFMERLSARKKLMITLTAFAGVETLDGHRRTVLYRVAQEALTNVSRHARATAVDMTITEHPGMIRMRVADNGRSFPVLQILSSTTHKRLGLLGMRERVEMIGGTLTIESTAKTGTTVLVEIPFATGAAV